MALTEAEADALAGKIARLALLWAGGDPARIAEAITILESSPALGVTGKERESARVD